MLRQTCDLHNLPTMTTVLNIYPEPHTQSAGAPSNLQPPLPVNNNHSVRHTPWTSHSVSRCSVRPAISTTCQQQPVLNIYPEPHTQSAGAPSNLRSPLPVNNNHSVRHTPWTSHSVSRCSVRPAISTTCQQQPVLNIYPEPHTPSAGAPSNLRSPQPVNNNQY